MKLKLAALLIIILAGIAFTEKAMAAEGDVWITPVSQNVETSQYFDVEVHADTGGKQVGAFNLYFDFTAADLTVNTLLGTSGVDKGTSANNYNVMVNSNDLANGHLRVGGICAQNCATGNNVHLLTVHNVSAADFTSGTSALSLRINELTNELGVALATGTITGATIVYQAGDTAPPVYSSGSPTGTLNAGTTSTTLSLSTNENATCKFGIVPNTAYDSIVNTFDTTGTTTHSHDLSGLSEGTSYNYYVRCEDGTGVQNTHDYVISFGISNTPTNITLSQTAINEGQAINAVVGGLTTTDADSGDTHTYSLACDTPAADDASFNISSANLRTSEVFDYETKSSYAVCIRTDDGHGGIFDKNFTITVNDLDDSAPTLAEVTPVSTPTTDNTPDYVFSSDEAGTISYAGGCSSATTAAIVGDNTITFNQLADGTYDSCTVTVTDSANNASEALAVTSFVVDASIPTITSVSSSKANGAYKVGEVIDVDVTFSENVTSTGDVTVTLETGATDRTCTFTVSGANTGTCDYTVQAGDTSADLNANSIAGTIEDASGNAIVNFTPATNLAANKALVIDTTNPAITINNGTDAGPTGDDTINIAVTDTNINASSLRYGFSADNTCNSSDTYGNNFTSGTSFHITTDHSDYLCVTASDVAINTVYQLVGQLNVQDVTAPVLSAGSPSGELTMGTTSANLTLSTDETATCKFGTTSGTAYADMTNTFSTTNATSHSESLSGLANGTNYIYYVRCIDGNNNVNDTDYVISFSISDEAEDEDDDVVVDSTDYDISSPYVKISRYIKEKIRERKTVYVRNEEFYFKGADESLAGGTVKLYEGSDKEDEDSIDDNGDWKLKTEKKKNKTYTYKIKYYSANGDKVETKTYKVEVDSEDPEFTDLPERLSKSRQESVWWKAKDNLGIKKFKVYFNGRISNIDAPKNKDGEEAYSSFQIPQDLTRGTYPMTIKAYDKAGNTTIRNVDILVR